MPSPFPIALAFLLMGPSDPPPAKLSALDVVAAREEALGDAIVKAEPSVVAISREKSENEETTAVRGRDSGPRPFDRRGLPNPFDPFGADVLSFDFGSGVVVGEANEILTAYHVVRGASRLHVRASARVEFDAEIIAADPHSDLAVIAPRPGPNPLPKLKPIAVGDSGKLRKGSFLVALGNPFNAARDGKPSAGWGILANVARQVEASAETAPAELTLRNYPTLLQLDAKLNLGMSGGAVVNARGEFVGLTTAAANASGYDAQAGYAIPMDALGRRVVARLKQGKEYEYGFLGIKLDTPHNTSRVESAEHGSPAAEGGVRVGDLIVAVGDLPVIDADSLFVAINSVPAGESVKLKLVRQNATIVRLVTLAKKKVRGPVIVTSRPNPWRGVRVDYTSTLANTAVAPEQSDAMSKRGVVVTEVATGSEAEKAGLKPGQIITRVDGLPTPNPREFEKAVPDRGPVKLETDKGSVTVK